MFDPSQLLSLNLNYWFLQTVAMLVTALIIPRLRVTSVFGALTVVIALGFVNSKVWDAALFFHIPNTLSIQTVLLLLTNGIIFWILVKLLPGIEVDGFLPALVAPVVFTFCSLVICYYEQYIDWLKVLDVAIGVLQGLREYFNETVPTKAPEITSMLLR